MGEMLLDEVRLECEPLERFAPFVSADELASALRVAGESRARLRGRTAWNVNSTAVGGGVAELLHALLPYARGAGIDARWVVIHGSPGFFRITKRLHNALQGEPGDGSPLGDEERALYEATSRENVAALLACVRPGDVVVLHDPQTAGLAPQLTAYGARVIWRCHIGADAPNAQTALGWAFLGPYLASVRVLVFSRRDYAPPGLDPRRVAVIAPSIDPFLPKNQPLEPGAVRAILAHVGLVAATDGEGAPLFHRVDGSPGRVDRAADVIRLGPAPAWDAPLVVQISRWDELKDPVGVIQGFAHIAECGAPAHAELLLAGPTVTAVADDPDAARVFEHVTEVWRALPHALRRRVHLANLPMADVEENAAVVNALQRHATIVVQKSLREGFGLTVAEAMWKSRPVVASAVGGIRDQIDDGVEGLLVRDPRDLRAFGEALCRLLRDPALADAMGARGHDRVRREFLGLRSLLQYAAATEKLERDSDAAARPAMASPPAAHRASLVNNPG